MALQGQPFGIVDNDAKLTSRALQMSAYPKTGSKKKKKNQNVWQCRIELIVRHGVVYDKAILIVFVVVPFGQSKKKRVVPMKRLLISTEKNQLCTRRTFVRYFKRLGLHIHNQYGSCSDME